MKTNFKKVVRTRIKEAIVWAKMPVGQYCKKPDFLIIGAQKAGTTALFNYLSKHPDIGLPIKKEIHFFDLNYFRGVNWYLAHFPLKFKKKKITGEATPYYLFHPYVPKRVYQYFPDIKLIIILRNPIDRAFSHFQMEVRNGREKKKNFNYAFENEILRLNKIDLSKLEDPYYQDDDHRNHLYFERGKYSKQISAWLNYFPKSNIHIILYEEFFSDVNTNFKKVCTFLNIKKIEIRNSKIYNKGNYNKIETKTRDKYLKYLQIEKNNLEKLLNKKINWNN